MIPDNGIEHGVLGVSGLIRLRSDGHALRYRKRGTPGMPKDGYGEAANFSGPRRVLAGAAGK